jgi:hypothetical protein
MQLAGISCAICKQNVMVDSDATWCARCSTVVHSQCLARVGEICPTCQQTYDRPEAHFVLSQQGPECFRPNNPPQAQCASCAARTRWDTQAAFNDFLAHMKDTSRVCILRGIAELFGGALCLLALVAMFYVSRRPGFIGLSLFLFGFITLTADGLVSLMRSRRIARFR